MKTKFSVGTLAVATFVVFAGVSTAKAEPLVLDRWQSGNAAFECAEVGEFVYSLKFNEAGDEGAPNGTEVAEFFDLDGALIHSNEITILDSDGKVFDFITFPNGIGAVIVKAGTGANVYYFGPQASSAFDLYAYQGKEISHVTFCWNPEIVKQDEWCSPGYWRQEHHLDSWLATGYSPSDLFHEALGYYPTLSRLGARTGASTTPTLWQVLQSPQSYGGDAFNAVGDLLSAGHPDVAFLGDRVEDSCPLN
jgi:hypothetical protein